MTNKMYFRNVRETGMFVYLDNGFPVAFANDRDKWAAHEAGQYRGRPVHYVTFCQFSMPVCVSCGKDLDSVPMPAPRGNWTFIAEHNFNS